MSGVRVGSARALRQAAQGQELGYDDRFSLSFHHCKGCEGPCGIRSCFPYLTGMELMSGASLEKILSAKVLVMKRFSAICSTILGYQAGMRTRNIRTPQRYPEHQSNHTSVLASPPHGNATVTLGPSQNSHIFSLFLELIPVLAGLLNVPATLLTLLSGPW